MRRAPQSVLFAANTFRLIRSAVFWLPCTLLVHTALNLQAVFPPFYQINPADEAGYIFGGRAVMNNLSEHRAFLPFFYVGPLIDAMTALIYAPLHDNPSWFLITEWVAHVILLCLLWSGSYLIAREFRSVVHPAVVMGLLTISPIVPTLLQNASDALFAAMSGFGFWLFLKFRTTRNLLFLAGASAFIGLSALARSDGLILFCVFVALAIGVSVGAARASVGSTLRAAAVAFLPFSVLVFGYLVAFGITNGVWDPGTEWRAYFAFEQAEGFTYDPSPQGLIDGPLLARELYGTPDDNHYSVLNAIMHNPQAFERRLAALPPVFFFILLLTYGAGFAVLLFTLASVGVVELVRMRQFGIVLTLLAWPAYLLTYIVFFARGGYLLTPYFCVDILAAVGIVTCLRGVQQLVRRGLGPVSHRQIVWLNTAAAAALVVVGLVASGPVAAPRLPVLGASGEEQASFFMSQHFERSTLIAALLPADVWTAKMTWQPLVWDLSAGDGPTTGRFGKLTVENATDLDEWIARTGVKAFYLDYLLKQYQPTMYAAIESDIGHRLHVVFQTEDMDAAKARYLTSQGYPYDGLYRIVAVDDDGAG